MKREESKILFSEYSRREMVFSDAVYHSLYTLVSCVQRSLYVPCKHDLYPLPLHFPQYPAVFSVTPLPTLSAIHMSSSAFKTQSTQPICLHKANTDEQTDSHTSPIQHPAVPFYRGDVGFTVGRSSRPWVSLWNTFMPESQVYYEGKTHLY